MAAPDSMNTHDLSGVYVMSKSLSDANRDDILKYQGVSWVTRNAVWYGTVTLYVKHDKTDNDVEHINIRQTITGGFEGTTEDRILDWQEREHEDHVFGHVKAKSRRASPGDFDNEWLQKGWLPETEEHGVINSFVASTSMAWTAEQTWGFENIEVEPGKTERRYVRHIQFLDVGKDVKCKLVYDYRECLCSIASCSGDSDHTFQLAQTTVPVKLFPLYCINIIVNEGAEPEM
ncbi:hypothetical protein FIBSPDRAFT_758188 [Athelia psychrophila]|uniref:Uncharacterized protein n=1 Tax=Athelia psychrophila TaxID=1759441 RepID=A0A165ZFU9_9AGAM|nr:hypothetical protein FIBSPDRAFT_758188 [Fibularhizoctonia sp. CBS 109695]